MLYSILTKYVFWCEVKEWSKGTILCTVSRNTVGLMGRFLCSPRPIMGDLFLVSSWFIYPNLSVTWSIFFIKIGLYSELLCLNCIFYKPIGPHLETIKPYHGPQFFLIKTDGKNYELFRVCNDTSDVILFSQIFDLEYPPGSGYDLIITTREQSTVQTYFSLEIQKVRQREWMRLTRTNDGKL